MNRLTRRSKVGEGFPMKHLNLMHMDTTSEDTLTEILEKLAAYEDTDLNPDEIERLESESIMNAIKLQEYKNLEEQGLLIKLPCKVGDKVWIADKGYNDIWHGEINAIYYDTDDDEWVLGSWYGHLRFEDFGKKAFFTREEAEKALEASNEM